MRHFRLPFVLARMAAYRTVLVTVLVITLMVGAVLAALAVYDARALRQAAFERLAGADTAITVTASTQSAAQFSAQTAAVRADELAALGPGAGTVTGVLWSNAEALPAGAVPGAAPTDQDQTLLAGFGSLGTSAKLLKGHWPGAAQAGTVQVGTVQAAVPEAVATSLRLTVGSTLQVRDTITNSGIRIVVSGIFRPLGSQSAYAQLDQIPADGLESASPYFTYGPLVVDPAAFTGGTVSPNQTAWDVQPSPQVLSGRNPDTNSAAIHNLTAAIQNSSVLGTSQVTTTLPTQLSALSTARNTARAELAGIALILLTLTITALIITSRPLGAQREAETYLLALRGRSRRQAALANVGEATALGAVTMVAAAPAGTLLAVFLGRNGPLGGGTSGSSGTGGGSGAGNAAAAAGAPLNAALPPGDAWLAGLGVALFAGAILIAAAARKHSATGRLERSGRPPRLAGAARAGIDLAVLALAAAAYWQLRSLSSGTPADPLLVLAPALALLACALLCLRLLPPLAGLGDRLAARGRRLGTALTAWQISRRPRHHAGPALLIVLAVAGGTFALCQHATRERSIGDQSGYAAGAQVRLDISGSSFAPAVTGAVAADRSVRAATPVFQTTGYNGSIVLAMDSRTAPETVLTRPDQYSSSPAALWSDLRAGAPKASALPGRPASVSLNATLGGGVSGAQLVLTVEDALDQFIQLPAQSLPADGQAHTLAFPIGAGADYPLRAAEISLNYLAPQSQTPNDTLSVSALASSAGSVPLPLGGWSEQIQSSDLRQAVRAVQTGTTDLPAANAATAGTPIASGSVGPGGWAVSFTPGYGLVPASSGASFIGEGPPSIIPAHPAQVTLSLAPTAAAELPVLATGAFLTSSRLTVGAVTQVAADGRTLPALIVGSVAAFPTISGSDFTGGLVLDGDALQYRLLDLGEPPLTATSYWLDTAGGAVPAGLPEGGVTVTTLAATQAALTSDPLTELIQQGLVALGTAAGILAIAALWAAVAAARRERADQEAVLIALGVSGRRQALLQAGEILAVAGPAAVAGLAIGVLLSRLMLPYLTLTSAAAVPVPSAVIVVAWLPSLALAAAMILAPALAAALSVVASRADATDRLRSLEVS